MSTALLTLTQGKTALTEAEILIMQEMQDDTAAFDMQPTRVKIAPGGIGQFLMGDDTARRSPPLSPSARKSGGIGPVAAQGNRPFAVAQTDASATLPCLLGTSKSRTGCVAHAPILALFWLSNRTPHTQTISTARPVP